ncbi:MAG: 30S ribosomal protein S17 [Endomicrobia bacterium]|nr:30S ribosomal protein S17 [Endomicrobiia bacterium]MCL2506850.1 30S ribosomal protein S17 [Endomicrobiia bacterium]
MSERGKRTFRTGVVVNDKSDKTIMVSVSRTYRHSLYDRVLRSKRKFATHDEKNEARIGDTVKIMESRPISKSKKWVLVEIISKAQAE